MLTKRENFLETIRGGEPDRLVNQYEFLELVLNPVFCADDIAPGKTIVSQWGYTLTWEEGMPGEIGRAHV